MASAVVAALAVTSLAITSATVMHGPYAPRSAPRMAQAAAVPCTSVLAELFGGVTIDAAQVAGACSSSVKWIDMGLDEAVSGPAAVENLLKERYPEGSRLVMERVSDGLGSSGGFSWRREAEGVEGTGLRGVTYVELDKAGRIEFVQEGYEPIFKLDKGLEVIFKLAGALVDVPEKPPTNFERATPTDAAGIARYLWQVAYPGGADTKEALRFFADEIVYEDFNYREPFVGLEAVRAYINLLPSFPNVEFVAERISEGERCCCLTWKVVVNGEDGPAGISINEVNSDGKIAFARDIPAPKPAPLGKLAGSLRPRLRTFTPRSPAPRASAPKMAATETEVSGGLEAIKALPSRWVLLLLPASL